MAMVRWGMPVAALRWLAEADAFLGLGLGRRAALWAICGLADGELPLFAAADRGGLPAPEATEREVPLAAMPDPPVLNGAVHPLEKKVYRACIGALHLHHGTGHDE